MTAGIRRRLRAVLVAATFAFACGPPPFVVQVTWPGEVPLEEGAPVLYEGVPIGHVQDVALLQESADQPARISVTLAITDPKVALRQADRFHLASQDGRAIVEVQPALSPSPPLASGATVPGVPPLLTRMEQRIEEAIESIGDIALETIEHAIEALEDESFDETPDDAARADPTPPR